MSIPKEQVMRNLHCIPTLWMLTDKEAEWVYDTFAALQGPRNVVELGTWCGRAFYVMGCALAAGSTLTTVDLFEGGLSNMSKAHRPVEEFGGAGGIFQQRIWSAVHEQLKDDNPLINTRNYVGDSAACAKYYEDASVDVLVVDADHSYEGVKRDLDAWLPKVKKSGLVIAHDYNATDWPGVVKAMDERFGAMRRIRNTRYGIVNT